MATRFTSVDEYLAAQPPANRAFLDQVRAAIREAVPEAEESISYQIPTYRLPSGVVLYFAGWRNHFSLYPINSALLEAMNLKRVRYEINEKGTMRFPLSVPVPIQLIASIAKYRAREIARLKS